MMAFELRIWPGPGLWPGSTSSSPVETTATLGRTTRGRATPTDASTPRCAGFRTVPGGQDDLAGPHLAAAGRMF